MNLNHGTAETPRTRALWVCKAHVRISFLNWISFYNQSRNERYVKDTFQWMVPFLHRCEGQREGAAKSLLREYLVNLAQRDLTLPLIIFQHSKPDVSIWTHTSIWLFVPCQGRCRIPGAVKCYIYDPIRAEPRTALLAIRKHAAHTHKHTASMLMYEKGSVMPWHTHAHTVASLVSFSASRSSSGTQTSWWRSLWSASTAVRETTSSASVMTSWSVCRRGATGQTRKHTHTFTHNVRHLRLIKNLQLTI